MGSQTHEKMPIVLQNEDRTYRLLHIYLLFGRVLEIKQAALDRDHSR